MTVTFAKPPAAHEANEQQQASTSSWFSRSAAKALVAGGSQAEPAAAATASAKSFVDSVISELAEDGPAWLRRTEFEWDLTQRQQPEFSLLTIQPLYRSSGGIDTVFVQARIAYGRGRRTTGNLGFGYRRLIMNGTAMLGANAFYDYEWPYSHARWGLGVEVRSGPVELNSNIYHALSGRSQITTNTHERALDGYDVELGVQVPYLPWARVYARRFHWQKKEGARNINGQRLALRIQPDFPLEIEAGVQDDNVTNSAYFVLFRVSLVLGRQDSPRALPLIDKRPFRTVDLHDVTLEPVRRENTIRVEQTTTGAAGTATVTISRGT